MKSSRAPSDRKAELKKQISAAQKAADNAGKKAKAAKEAAKIAKKDAKAAKKEFKARRKALEKLEEEFAALIPKRRPPTPRKPKVAKNSDSADANAAVSRPKITVAPSDSGAPVPLPAGG